MQHTSYWLVLTTSDVQALGVGDLRNRHKRRCLQSFDGLPKPRQKSCDHCVSSKLRCDLEVPSFSRCTTRKLRCHRPATLGAQTQDPSSSDQMYFPGPVLQEAMETPSGYLCIPQFTMSPSITATGATGYATTVPFANWEVALQPSASQAPLSSGTFPLDYQSNLMNFDYMDIPLLDLGYPLQWPVECPVALAQAALENESGVGTCADSSAPEIPDDVLYGTGPQYYAPFHHLQGNSFDGIFVTQNDGEDMWEPKFCGVPLCWSLC